MKRLGLEVTCIRIHMLQVGSPFLSGRWLTLLKQKPLQNYSWMFSKSEDKTFPHSP